MGKNQKSNNRQFSLHQNNAIKFKKQQKSQNKIKSTNASTNPYRILTKEKQKGVPQSHFRTKGTIKRLNLMRQKPDIEKMNKQPENPNVRVEPDRKWFGNVRTITQNALDKFRSEMAQRIIKSNALILKQSKLPLSLLIDPMKEQKINILSQESFEDTFGAKSKRKQPKISNSSLQQFMENIELKNQNYTQKINSTCQGLNNIEENDIQKEIILQSGQSKRIWQELYKVIDASDVLCQVIDARDPNGTRSLYLEQLLKKHFPQKHIILILNKIDLIPTFVTKKWITYLSQYYPTVGFRASITHPFGKQTLINLLRQIDNFHKEKQCLSIGFIGYPNVGKSSVINCIKAKKVCKSAPIPGETKIWQYIHLTKRLYLIDCPGIVYYNEGKNDNDIVLKGVVRAEKLEDPASYINEIIKKVNKNVLNKLYKLDTDSWDDAESFLKSLGLKRNRLLKGGEPDIQTVAKQLIVDWQRGEIPYYSLPPNEQKEEEDQQQNITQQSNQDNELQEQDAINIQQYINGEKNINNAQ